jgi:hypothetical protein
MDKLIIINKEGHVLVTMEYLIKHYDKKYPTILAYIRIGKIPKPEYKIGSFSLWRMSTISNLEI